jgi:hypothetical protein
MANIILPKFSPTFHLIDGSSLNVMCAAIVQLQTGNNVVSSLNGITGTTALTSPDGTFNLTAENGNIGISAGGLVARQSIASFSMNSDAAGNESTNNSLNARSVAYAPGNSALTDIVVAYPGSSFGPTAEVDNPAAFTVTAAIEYPVGTFTVLYTQGQRTLTVTPGRTIAQFDPCSSLVIPAGAQFWIKSWINWPIPGGFYDNSYGTIISGTTCRFGVSVPDQTLTTITTPGTSGGIAGGTYIPIIYGTTKSPVVLGIIGTSHDRGSGDVPDPNSGGSIAWARAMRGQIPITTFSKIGVEAAQYLTRPDGASIMFRDKITHLLVDMATNDIFALSISLATAQANLLAIIAPFLLRGVKVYTLTVTPRSSSTDSWMTVANQSLLNTPAEPVRVAYNAWLRASWQSIGLAAPPFDIARVMDPTDSGVFAVDAGAQFTTVTGQPPQRAWCVMSSGVGSAGNGSVASMPLAFGSVNGGLFTNNLSGTVNCNVYNCPGDTTGSGAVVVGNTDGTGKITSWTVQNGGSLYEFPPMIAPIARPTLDGIHFNGGTYDRVIATLGLGPQSFT